MVSICALLYTVEKSQLGYRRPFVVERLAILSDRSNAHGRSNLISLHSSQAP